MRRCRTRNSQTGSRPTATNSSSDCDDVFGDLGGGQLTYRRGSRRTDALLSAAALPRGHGERAGYTADHLETAGWLRALFDDAALLVTVLLANMPLSCAAAALRLSADLVNQRQALKLLVPHFDIETLRRSA